MKLPKPHPLHRRLQRGTTPQVAVAPLLDEFDDDDDVSDIDPAIIADAGELLKKERYDRLLMTSDAGARLKWFSEQLANARKISRKQHIDRIAHAYASFAISRDNFEIRETVVHVALEREKTYDPRTSELRLFVEAFISYGTEEDDARRAGHAYSRDVAAIKTLIKRRVLPSEVAVLALEPGEGLDAWARANAKSKQDQRDLVIGPASEVVEGPAKKSGNSRSKPAKLAPEPVLSSGRLTWPPFPERFSWVVMGWQGEAVYKELKFVGSQAAADILTRCYDDLIALEVKRTQEEPRPAVQRKPATLNIGLRRLRSVSRKTPA